MLSSHQISIHSLSHNLKGLQLKLQQNMWQQCTLNNRAYESGGEITQQRGGNHCRKQKIKETNFVKLKNLICELFRWPQNRFSMWNARERVTSETWLVCQYIDTLHVSKWWLDFRAMFLRQEVSNFLLWELVRIFFQFTFFLFYIANGKLRELVRNDSNEGSCFHRMNFTSCLEVFSIESGSSHGFLSSCDLWCDRHVKRNETHNSSI